MPDEIINGPEGLITIPENITQHAVTGCMAHIVGGSLALDFYADIPGGPDKRVVTRILYDDPVAFSSFADALPMMKRDFIKQQ